MRLETLTKRNPKVSNMENIGISTAGGVSSADISAACYKLDQVSDSLLAAHVNGSEKELRRLLTPTFKMINGKMENTGGLFSPIFQETLKLALERRWRAVKKGEDRLRVLTMVAIDNVVSRPVCVKCDGTKYVENLKCSSCKGSGQKRFNATKLAKEMNIAESTYRENWQYKYNDIVCMIEHIMYKAGQKICL